MEDEAIIKNETQALDANENYYVNRQHNTGS